MNIESNPYIKIFNHEVSERLRIADRNENSWREHCKDTREQIEKLINKYEDGEFNFGGQPVIFACKIIPELKAIIWK